MLEEIWADLPGYEGLYRISNLGEIVSTPRKGTNGGTKQYRITHKGYAEVTLCKDGKQRTEKVHRLVALTFIPNPNNLPEVNHRDENKLNNRVDNLEWCTTQYNLNYGTRTVKSGRPVQCVETGKIYPGSAWAARELGFDQSTITKCCKNPNRATCGYHWKYVEDTQM